MIAKGVGSLRIFDYRGVRLLPGMLHAAQRVDGELLIVANQLSHFHPRRHTLKAGSIQGERS